MGAVALVPSRHAIEAMEARAVTWGEVVTAVRYASVIDTHQGRRRYFYQDLCVVVAEDGTVVTVLMRDAKHWSDAEMRARRSSLE